jgi:P-type Cu2+ transporter
MTHENHGPGAGPASHDDHAGHHDHDDHDVLAQEHAGHVRQGDPAGGGHGGHDHSGHGGHDHSDHVTLFRNLFWIMLVFAIPTTLLSHGFANLIGYSLPDTPLVNWTPVVLGTIMYLWGGRPFLTGAVSELRDRRPGMMMLISLGITVAFLSSWAAFLGIVSMHLEFWWELALLVVIMLLGHWIEMRSLASTQSALGSLAALLPDTAERLTADGTATEEVTPEELRLEDIVLVRPGGRVPADGVIVAGSAAMDESMITGESRPVARGEGEQVVAGTIATDSGIRVEVTAIGDDTALSGIARLVDEAQRSASRAQRLADKAAGWLFWYALGAAALSLVAWLLLGTPQQALTRVITVLVIACPHALGLAIPLVVSIATERAARAGVLVKSRMALEAMRTVDVVLFDKTGTLTKGSPVVGEIRPAGDRSADEILMLAAAAERESEHPLAKAITASAAQRGLTVPAAADFTSSPALGVTARVGGAEVSVGGPGMLENHGLTELDVDDWKERGAIILHVVADGQVLGALALDDEIRGVSRQAVDALHARGIEVAMITGDAEAVARSVGRELGIDQVFAGVRPEGKGAAVKQLQDQGTTVAMVGDGVNDAPALAQADIGLAIGAGTDVAIASADVVLAADDPRAVLSVIELSERAYRKMVQNLWWAAGYNLIAVPLAAGVLAPIGFVMPMAVGALLMSASTVVVALNAQLLRRVDLSPDALVGATPAQGTERGAPAASAAQSRS